LPQAIPLKLCYTISNMKSCGQNKQGFTIVELLIVIVVIGILAAISVVAYGTIQQSARDTSRTAEVNGLMKAIEQYKIDNGMYPSVGTDNSGYAVSTLASALVPTYMQSIPADPNTSLTNYQYVRGTVASNSYGIRISYEAKTPCHRGVGNNGIGWWSLQAC
jgi:type II secretion system protein G